MGFLDKIKTWFRRRKKLNVPVEDMQSETVIKPPTEMEVLIQEHEHLEAERNRLKKEIEVVDSQYSDGSIAAADRDRAYRTRLARAGSIRIRQMQIRNKLLSMGHPLSQRTTSATIAY